MKRSLVGALAVLAGVALVLVGGFYLAVMSIERELGSVEKFLAVVVPWVVIVGAVYVWVSGWSRYARNRMTDDSSG